MKKYKTLFRDCGKKEHYTTSGDQMEIKGENVAEVMESITFDIATSWDYIPGRVFKKIYDLRKKDPKTFSKYCESIAKLLSLLLESDEIPEEIICARLICLNKCPGENGKLENIRPIAITGTLIKILEKITLIKMQVVEKVMGIENHRSQIVFLKGMGCDVILI